MTCTSVLIYYNNIKKFQHLRTVQFDSYITDLVLYPEGPICVTVTLFSKVPDLPDRYTG